MSFKFMIIVLGILAMAACTPKNKVVEEIPVSSLPMIESEAVPDTLDYNFLTEETITLTEESPVEADLPVLESKPEAVWTIPEDKPEPKAAADLFWVQIFATRSRDKAEQIAGDAEDRLSHIVETHFLDPYYKVLVGGFEIREDAVKLRDTLVGKGYRDAWIVEF
jgi:hypothetical protein